MNTKHIYTTKVISLVSVILLVGFGIISPFEAENIEKTSVESSYSNTLYVGGNGPGNYSRIGEALADVEDGDTIFVFQGEYHEHNLIVNKSISLVGEKKKNTVIDGDDTHYDILIFRADGISMHGFTVRDAGPNMDGISIWSDGNNVTDCDFLNNNNRGIIIFQAHYNRISQCYFEGNHWGLKLEGGTDEVSSYNIISNCVFHGDDILSRYACYNIITDCDIRYSNGNGIT